MSERITYRAKWLLPDPWSVLENGYVQAADNVILDIGSGRPPGDMPVVDLGSGVLMAPLVNAHTHLELSALKDSLPFDMGFRHWVSELLRKRAALSGETLLAGAENAIGHLVESGCRVVGDISTLGITRQPLLRSPLSGIFFQEHLGNFHSERFQTENSESVSISLAAHAPHTTTPALFRRIKEATASNGLPMSVHLAESEDEFLFINSGRGKWADLLTERNIDFSDWPLPAKSPVQYLNALGVLDAGTLAVHLIYCSEEDLQLLHNKSVTVCFCPRSNSLLHGKLPDIPCFLASGFKPCLGTDSLASSPSLSILDEMAFISAKYYSVSPSDIIAMGTVYGAAALGKDKNFGRLAPGFSGAPVYVPIETDKPSAVFRAIVTAGNAELNPISKKAIGI